MSSPNSPKPGGQKDVSGKAESSLPMIDERPTTGVLQQLRQSDMEIEE